MGIPGNAAFNSLFLQPLSQLPSNKTAPVPLFQPQSQLLLPYRSEMGTVIDRAQDRVPSASPEVGLSSPVPANANSLDFLATSLSQPGGGTDNTSTSRSVDGIKVKPKQRGIPLALSCDSEHLSAYQMLVREQLEIFEATEDDIQSSTQGRKKKITVGQVGIRCKHCASYPVKYIGKGAVYYPAKLQVVYQAAQNMAGSHLSDSCRIIPQAIKERLRTLRERKDSASGGKQYWADGCRAIGLMETERSGLRLRHKSTSSPQTGREGGGVKT